MGDIDGLDPDPAGPPAIEVAERAGVGIDGRDRPTEDRVVLLPNAVVLADGATSLRPGERSGGWYAEKLTRALADGLVARPVADLGDVLGDAISRVAVEHGLVPGESPSSTVAMLRWTADRVDVLVLADSPVVVFTDTGAEVLADDRLASLPRPASYRTRLREGDGFGDGHVAALRASGARTRTLRNTPGGFWVAEADPEAARQACRADWPRRDLRAALLASDGVSCGVDDYHLFDWPGVLEVADREGAAGVLARVRAAESADPDGRRWPRPKRHDDQALVLLRF